MKVGSMCLVPEDTVIKGDVTIGNGTIIHPRASIIATAGPIIIGEHNLIEEKVVIKNSGTSGSGSTPVMIIGNYNVFEVGSRSEALKVGDYNVFESKSVVGKEVVVSNNCTVGAGCVISNSRVLPENTSFYGPECNMRKSQGNQPQILQMDFLRKVLPNYHPFANTKKSAGDEGQGS